MSKITLIVFVVLISALIAAMILVGMNSNGVESSSTTQPIEKVVIGYVRMTGETGTYNIVSVSRYNSGFIDFVDVDGNSHRANNYHLVIYKK